MRARREQTAESACGGFPRRRWSGRSGRTCGQGRSNGLRRPLSHRGRLRIRTSTRVLLLARGAARPTYTI
eukprot:5983262-Pyramimonas_sp.AAC.1